MLQIHEIIDIRRLRWAGHVSRMSDIRTPHQIAFGELQHGKRGKCKPKKRWLDALKNNFKSLNIPELEWRNLAADRNAWRQKIKENIHNKHTEGLDQMKQKREDRHIIEENFIWKCPICPFIRTGKQGRQYVLSHLSQSHRDQIPPKPTAPTLNCLHCTFVAKKGAGLNSHMRHKHPNITDMTLKPIKLIPTTSTSASNNTIRPNKDPSSHKPATTTTASPKWACPRPRCNRLLRSNAGLKSHLRANNCRFLRDEESSDSTDT